MTMLVLVTHSALAPHLEPSALNTPKYHIGMASPVLLFAIAHARTLSCIHTLKTFRRKPGYWARFVQQRVPASSGDDMLLGS